MIERAAHSLEPYLRIPEERLVTILRRIVVAVAAAIFVLAATALVAFESVFPGARAVASLKVGDVAPRNIHAPEATVYISEVLTEQRRQAARNAVSPVYDPPDPNVARIQTQLARQILDFINDVRRDPFATLEQKASDINQITALSLEPEIVDFILDFDDESWKEVDDQIVNVLERVMREPIREVDVRSTLDQLPSQVGVRLSAEEVQVVVAIVADLIRPNRFENPTKTEEARVAAASGVAPVERSFERGQIVVGDGEPIDEAAFEALTELELLKPDDRRLQEIARGFLASIIVMVVIGLYTARFKPHLLYSDPRMLTLLAVIFLFTLTGARFLGVSGQIYIFPSSALALLYVTIVGPEIAIIGSLGLAILMGLMAGNSMEITTLVTVGGLMGSLTLSRAERLNNYFFAGLMIAVANIGVVAIFNLAVTVTQDLSVLTVYSLLNGILAAAVAVAGMYVITLLFNLPTSLKLLELSQPNQPLLQRLLREAPGTYQHSLQVANLCEQAANAIGANAPLVHIAALYHDIGKLLNPAFFTENQRDIGNPHDIINDPYRSASIIIGHVTEGDELARQHRLPNRIRDFIREHHGTTRVYVFYQQAVNNAGGDESAVDPADFTYPGPRPQSRETGLMMLADTCEAAVRSNQPLSKKEIEEMVHSIFDSKRKEGQLDDSSLTLKDLKVIQNIFVDMLQAVFHPRINYATAAAKVTQTAEPTSPRPALITPPSTPKVKTEPNRLTQESKPTANDGMKKPETLPIPTPVETPSRPPVPPVNDTAPRVTIDDDLDSPLPDVPPLPRTGEHRVVNNKPKLSNGKMDDLEDKEAQE
jgi:putative nucleotidyltransferase with HDIG domain